MRVLVCPDKFAGTLSAEEAAAAIAEGWLSAYPSDELVLRPLADGGPGFLSALRTAIGGRVHEVNTSDPLGRPVRGWILVNAGVAYLESAQACGLHLLREHEYDPTYTTSYGVGALVRAASRTRAKEVVIGLGGSATIDAGAGMLAGLGAVPLDGTGQQVCPGGTALLECTTLAGEPDINGLELIAATDVDNPLVGPTGASAVFGPQKGASYSEIEVLDQALRRFADVLMRELPTCPSDLPLRPGGGAAGGLGAAILACGGRAEPGFGLVRRLTRLDEYLVGSHLVITGEGRLDQQSAHGKTTAGVALAARDHSLPCVVIAGRVDLDDESTRRLGVAETHSLVGHFGSAPAAMAYAAQGLREVAAALARRWHRSE